MNNRHEFTKYEIATYLRDFNRTLECAYLNKGIPFYKIFKYHMCTDGRKQYCIIDYYNDMISIYEVFLVSKFFTILYDNYFGYLLDSSINRINIPDSIFVNEQDKQRFSNKQIIRFIRNAFNHNDNPNYDLLKIVRIGENGDEKIKIEIDLKDVNPIPFHVILDPNELIKICFELLNANSMVIGSTRSTKPISINSSNVNVTLSDMFIRKFFSRKKLTDEQKAIILSHIKSKKGTKNYEDFLLENGMEYKDIQFSLAQIAKVREDLQFWESLGEVGNDVIGHIIDKILPFSWSKEKTLIMNLLLTDYYMKNNGSLIDFVKDAEKIYESKTYSEDSPFKLYCETYGLDKNIVYDAADFENVMSIANAIYYGYLFDTLITDDEISIKDSKIVKREKLRDAFVHMRWFKGARESFKLFDWPNGIDNEYNQDNPNFWKYNVGFEDMELCAESYFQKIIKPRSNTSGYLDIPIHFKGREDGTLTSITFIKNGVLYCYDLTARNEESNLLVCDNSQKNRLATEEEKSIFISELDNLSEREKQSFPDIIDDIKNKLMHSPGRH